LAIKGTGGADWLSVSQIADRLFIRHHTAVELVDRLAGLGMVARKPDPSDGRRIRVAVTEDGEAVLRELSTIHIEELKNIRPTLRKLLKQFEAKRQTI
jgi:DNA-binding MarR family transcriptional regulator